MLHVPTAETTGRFCVDGHEYPNLESEQLGDGKYPPFRIFDIDNQEYLKGEYKTRADAERALYGAESAFVTRRG